MAILLLSGRLFKRCEKKSLPEDDVAKVVGGGGGSALEEVGSDFIES
jgi:hypothetical protein